MGCPGGAPSAQGLPWGAWLGAPHTVPCSMVHGLSRRSFGLGRESLTAGTRCQDGTRLSHPPSLLLLYKCPVTSVPGPPPCEAPRTCPPIPPGQGWPAASQPPWPAARPLRVCGGPGPTTPWTGGPASPTGGEGPLAAASPSTPAKSDRQLGRNEVTGGGGGAGDVCLERGGSAFRTHTLAGARAPHRPALPLWSGLFLFPGPVHLPSLPQSHPCLHTVSAVLGP